MTPRVSRFHDPAALAARFLLDCLAWLLGETRRCSWSNRTHQEDPMTDPTPATTTRDTGGQA